MAKGATIPKEISALEVRHHLGEILSQVANHRDRFIIKKAGIPTAILLSIQDYEDLEDLVDTALEQLNPAFQKSLERAKKNIAGGRYVRDEAMWQDLTKKEARAKQLARRRTS